MRAHARVVAAVADGRARLPVLRSQAPLVVRATGPGEVHLVGGAGGPLGGDRLRLELVVEPGAALTVRTAAASVVLPGAGGAASVLDVVATVGAGGRLTWLPEPVVAAGRCRHRSDARIELAADAALVWRDELVLGRSGERGGAVAARTSVTVGGRPVLRQELAVDGGGAPSPAVLDGHRATGTVVVVEPGWVAPPAEAVLAPGAAVLPLEHPTAALVTAVADDAVALRTLLDAGERAMGPRCPTRNVS